MDHDLKKHFLPISILTLLFCATALIGSTILGKHKSSNLAGSSANLAKTEEYGTGIYVNIMSDLYVVPTQDACFPGTIILGRPTAMSVTLSFVPVAYLSEVVINAVARTTVKGQIGSQVGQRIQNLSPYRPLEFELPGLLPSTAYDYQIIFTAYGAGPVTCPIHHFNTQRAKGAPFRFSIIADSHLGTRRHNDQNRYVNTLYNVKASNPDFLVSLGDDFRTSQLFPELKDLTNSSIGTLFLYQRPYYNLIGQDAFLFNVNGNHELQAGWLRDSTCQNPATWVITNRVEYYPNPFPDLFYAGDESKNPCVYGGYQESYYAWVWGDGLFIVIDDYLYSTGEGRGWDFSLGINQYTWLSTILQISRSEFKFVFHHHVNGVDRGGIELVSQYEWGGYTPQHGTFDWPIMRPAAQGWGALPIHQLLVQNHVTVVFQGHDHLYTAQAWPSDADPQIHYVTVPFPAFPTPTTFMGSEFDNSEGFFYGGTILPPSGHLNVDISGHTVTVSYMRSALPQDANYLTQNNRAVHTFSVPTKTTKTTTFKKK